MVEYYVDQDTVTRLYHIYRVKDDAIITKGFRTSQELQNYASINNIFISYQYYQGRKYPYQNVTQV